MCSPGCALWRACVNDRVRVQLSGVHVIVVGCGRVGGELAVQLEAQGSSVSVIDKDRRAFQRYLPEKWTGRAVLGNGFDRDHLEQAGIKEADALAACTGGDNTNIVCARVARETYEVSNVVARIQDPRRAIIYQRLGIPTVAQVAWTTDQVLRRLQPAGRTVDWTDPTGAIRLVEAALPDAWAGQRLKALEAEAWRVVLVQRGGASQLVTDDLVGQEGDVLHLAVRTDAAPSFEAALAAGPAH